MAPLPLAASTVTSSGPTDSKVIFMRILSTFEGRLIIKTTIIRCYVGGAKIRYLRYNDIMIT